LGQATTTLARDANVALRPSAPAAAASALVATVVIALVLEAATDRDTLEAFRWVAVTLIDWVIVTDIRNDLRTGQ